MMKKVTAALLLPFSYAVYTTSFCDDEKPPPTPPSWTGNWGSQLSNGLSKVRESTENIASKAADTGAAYNGVLSKVRESAGNIASKAADMRAAYNEVLQNKITAWKSMPTPDLPDSFIKHLKSKGYLDEENTGKNSTYFLNEKSKSVAIPLWLPDSSVKNHLYCVIVGVVSDQSSLDENGRAEVVSYVNFFFSETPDKPIFERQVPLATKIAVPGLAINLPGFEDYGSGGLFLEVKPKEDTVTQKMICTITIEAGYSLDLSAIVKKKFPGIERKELYEIEHMYFGARLYSFDTNFEELSSSFVVS